MAEMNEHLVTEPPRTFREACQWILWFQITARMYNGSVRWAAWTCSCSRFTTATPLPER